MTGQKLHHQVVWFDIPCIDLARAISFYEAVLGCKIAREEFDGFAMGILPHENSTVGGCLAVLEDTKPSNAGILLYMNCDGRLDEAISAAKENGATIQKDKHAIGPHGFRAIIVDSEGNRVALHST